MRGALSLLHPVALVTLVSLSTALGGCGENSPGSTSPQPDAVTDHTPEAPFTCPGDADPVLGTLVLQPGFRVAGSAVLPKGVSAVTGVARGGNDEIFALGGDKKVRSLGLWPALATPSEPLFEVIPAGEDGEDVHPSAYLVASGDWLLAGFTHSEEGAPGKVALYAGDTGEVSYLEAPGNYSAAGWGQSGFLVNGLNLGGPAWAVGVYGLNVESPAPNRTRPVAEFPETWRAANGYIAVTPAGVTVLGHYSSLDNRTRMHAVPPGPVRRALDGGGPLAVASGLEVYAGGDLLGAAAFGEGVALLRGAFESIPPYRAIPEEIRRVPLNVVRPNGGLEAVTAGDSEVVLDAVDACTEVPYLTSLGEGLALVISDARSRRLVVVAPE